MILQGGVRSEEGEELQYFMCQPVACDSNIKRPKTKNAERAKRLIMLSSSCRVELLSGFLALETIFLRSKGNLLVLSSLGLSLIHVKLHAYIAP
jgi:hypothetical protein